MAKLIPVPKWRIPGAFAREGDPRQLFTPLKLDDFDVPRLGDIQGRGLPPLACLGAVETGSGTFIYTKRHKFLLGTQVWTPFEGTDGVYLVVLGQTKDAVKVRSGNVFAAARAIRASDLCPLLVLGVRAV